jgi:uroporphyrinogen decarboxylase
MREKYGRQILLRGGINKHQLSKGKREILDELKRVEKLVHDGGFIPGLDHRCPQDISYENYKYYIREKLAMLGWSDGEVSAIWPIRSIESTFNA